jgi:hypothetical protein
MSVDELGSQSSDWLWSDSWALICVRGMDFSICHHIQTGCGAYPLSYPVGTGGSSPGATTSRA